MSRFTGASEADLLITESILISIHCWGLIVQISNDTTEELIELICFSNYPRHLPSSTGLHAAAPDYQLLDLLLVHLNRSLSHSITFFFFFPE